MEDLGDDKPSTIVDIFPKGDVILVVGSEKVKLRVHSMFLKTTSRPFSAMFVLVWNEGNMLGRDEPTEIPLPEDDASALQTICAIIHHQNKLVPQTLTASDVLGIAIAADKYDCVDALKFASTNWLQPQNQDVNLSNASYRRGIYIPGRTGIQTDYQSIDTQPRWYLSYSCMRRGYVCHALEGIL